MDDLSVVCSQALIGVGTPPSGSGIKVKVVEMMMNGLPMILTNSGAEGIPCLEGGCLNIDRLSEEDCSAQLSNWLINPSSAVKAGLAQARYLRKIFSPEVTLEQLAKLLNNCC